MLSGSTRQIFDLKSIEWRTALRGQNHLIERLEGLLRLLDISQIVLCHFLCGIIGRWARKANRTRRAARRSVAGSAIRRLTGLRAYAESTCLVVLASSTTLLSQNHRLLLSSRSSTDQCLDVIIGATPGRTNQCFEWSVVLSW